MPWVHKSTKNLQILNASLKCSTLDMWLRSNFDNIELIQGSLNLVLLLLYSLHTGKFFANFFCRLLNFSKSTFLKNSFGNTIRVSNTLDPDQARHSVGPDLGTNYLQRFSADDKICHCQVTCLFHVNPSARSLTWFDFLEWIHKQQCRSWSAVFWAASEKLSKDFISFQQVKG